MLLPLPDLELFFRLHWTLMFFVDRRLEVLDEEVASPEEYSALAPEVRMKVHEALLEHMDLIQAFVDENPAGLPEEQLDIVRSWRHLVSGKFYIVRQLKKYAVFLTAEDVPVAYGVLALSEPFEEVAGSPLPVLVQTTLLPFKDRIVYDGLMMGYRISFGPGIRRSLNESFKDAKDRGRLVTSLPVPAAGTASPARPSKAPKAPKAARGSSGAREKSKDEVAAVQSTIVGMTDRFCKEHLNEEYAELCRRLAGKLARKRPSPLLGGRPNTWAAAIVRTIGWVNFLHDRAQTPHMRLGDIDAAFGISESTGAAKMAAIRKMLKVPQLDPQWTLPSRLEDNPLVWMLEVNGLIVDVRHAPREVQEIAFNKGLIPYIPADRRQQK